MLKAGDAPNGAGGSARLAAGTGGLGGNASIIAGAGTAADGGNIFLSSGQSTALGCSSGGLFIRSADSNGESGGIVTSTGLLRASNYSFKCESLEK